MKKIIIASFLFVAILQNIRAASPCTTAFALGYAQARLQYYVDKAKCDELPMLNDWCHYEIRASFSNTVNNLFEDFNVCCCANNLTECCN